jgi:sugar lactone lactonase YvrE
MTATAVWAAPSHSTGSVRGNVESFGPVPDPGHPLGVLVTEHAVYAFTSAGQPWRRSDGEDAIFTYRPGGGAPVARTTVATMPDMGLYGAAEDADGRIYVVDMNGRILRYRPDDDALASPEVYATNPYASLGWQASMWMLPAFDSAGDLFITDASQGAIWKIPPNGQPSVWLADPRFRNVPQAGLNGIAVSPDQKWLYLALPGDPSLAEGASDVYRLPLIQTPQSTDLQLFHRFLPSASDVSSTVPARPTAHRLVIPGAADLAFTASGNLFVLLAAVGAVAELDTNGNETRRITSDLFDWPLSLRFQGHSLIIANSNDIPSSDDVPQDNHAASQLLKVDVGEQGMCLFRPRIPSRH